MAILGAGVALRYKTGPVSVGYLRNIEMPELAVDDVDVTTHADTDLWKKYIAGWKDGGEISVEFLYSKDDAGATALLSDLGGVAKTFEVVFPDSSVWEFDAYVKSYSHVAPLEDVMTGSATLKITGEPTFTPAGS